MEKLTGHDDIFCEFVLCTFNLLDVFTCCLCATREIIVFVILQQHMKYTLSRTKIKSLRYIFVYHLLFYICLFVTANLF